MVDGWTVYVLYIGFKTSDQQSSPLLCTGIAGKRRNTPNTLKLTSITENKCLSLHVSLLLKGVEELCGVVVQLKPQLDLFFMCLCDHHTYKSQDLTIDGQMY